LENEIKPYNLSCDDAIVYLKSFVNESVDLSIFDVAYESLEKHRKIGTTTRLKKSKGSSNEWFPIFPNSRFDILFQEMYRVMKRNSHMYCFCDNETMFIMKPIAEQYGFKFWNNIIWEKTNGPGMGYHYRNQYENILFFEKGKRKLNSTSITNILKFPRVKRKGAYPTQKPSELIEILVNQSSHSGEIVVDPFMGSGATGIAALKNNRIFYGNDIEQKSYDLVKSKLDDLLKQINGGKQNDIK
jgi:site-specific DNA-methyltransferase (adenine-specific)